MTCSYKIATLGYDWSSGQTLVFLYWDDDNEEHLARHHIASDEAEEVFFNRYIITPNKKKHGPKRYRVDGRTNQGRRLRLIFEDMGASMARIITGWDI